ncbi:MAG: lytic transglycosylase domain-containing protein, partial [Ferruginibacter sp.]
MPVILTAQNLPSQDTLGLKNAIDSLATSKTQITEESKTQINELTKYGFKNLFNNLEYNSSKPYKTQINPNAESYMQDYLLKNTSSLNNLKKSGVLYFNFIDNIFKQYGLPTELKYLAVIESNLNVNATSWVGAVGPWQFMSNTAREYGLNVNNKGDERTDYLKSTHAAANYLIYLYKKLNDWLLVIAAYNGGPVRVNTAIRKSGSKNF